ncbi:MAG: DNA-binding response regulator [Segetibacter sp.]|nr:DNA-binding response regulator [Segetibacter sp.]
MNDMQTMKCLLVDDEPPAREIIRRYIETMPMLELAGEYGNAIQALSFLQQNDVDLIFLDIRMPQLKGNEFLKVVKNCPPVIITTAHAEYALEGYELDVIDYLLKPIQFERFIKAVNKAFILKGHHTVETKPAKEQLKQENFVYFRADRKMVKVMLRDIVYIESMKDYVKVFTENGVIVTKQPLNAVEAMLPESQFIRTHRSYIVSLSKIKSYTHELLEVNKEEIPIGKLYRNEVLKMLE